MDVELARWLVSAEAAPVLAAAAEQPDPDSLAAAERLRRSFPSDQVAAALTQVDLRRRAASKFGPSSAELFFTPTGLEQSTRAEVARWRAERLAASGVSVIVDLGCGLGADALAFRQAGLTVHAVDADPVTAVFAAANLGQEVTCADATQVAGDLLDGGAAVFLDPARRTAAGRTWRVTDFSPSWDFATELLADRVGVIKAAPGLPGTLIPPWAEAVWVSHRGNLVETSLWHGVGTSGGRRAVLLPGRHELPVDRRTAVPVGPVGNYLYEPDPAVIRSGGVASLAEQLDATAPADGIAYLSSRRYRPTPFATGFEIIEVIDHAERTLRGWVRDRDVGVLEIKVRGLEIDPAVLRRRLKPRGRASATLVLTPTKEGARALVVRRLID